MTSRPVLVAESLAILNELELQRIEASPWATLAERFSGRWLKVEGLTTVVESTEHQYLHQATASVAPNSEELIALLTQSQGRMRAVIAAFCGVDFESAKAATAILDTQSSEMTPSTDLLSKLDLRPELAGFASMVPGLGESVVMATTDRDLRVQVFAADVELAGSFAMTKDPDATKALLLRARADARQPGQLPTEIDLTDDDVLDRIGVDGLWSDDPKVRKLLERLIINEACHDLEPDSHLLSRPALLWCEDHPDAVVGSTFLLDHAPASDLLLAAATKWPEVTSLVAETGGRLLSGARQASGLPSLSVTLD